MAIPYSGLLISLHWVVLTSVKYHFGFIKENATNFEQAFRHNANLLKTFY